MSHRNHHHYGCHTETISMALSHRNHHYIGMLHTNISHSQWLCHTQTSHYGLVTQRTRNLTMALSHRHLAMAVCPIEISYYVCVTQTSYYVLCHIQTSCYGLVSQKNLTMALSHTQTSCYGLVSQKNLIMALSHTDIMLWPCLTEKSHNGLVTCRHLAMVVPHTDISLLQKLQCSTEEAVNKTKKNLKDSRNATTADVQRQRELTAQAEQEVKDTSTTLTSRAASSRCRSSWRRWRKLSPQVCRKCCWTCMCAHMSVQTCAHTHTHTYLSPIVDWGFIFDPSRRNLWNLHCCNRCFSHWCGNRTAHGVCVSDVRGAQPHPVWPTEPAQRWVEHRPEQTLITSPRYVHPLWARCYFISVHTIHECV